MKPPPPPSQQRTIDAILGASERDFVPVRWSFVQNEVGGGAAPLAHLVRRGRSSTLEQYLLLHAWASAGDFDVKRDSRVWARALGLAEDESGRRTVGRNWAVLRELRLVEALRSGREVRARLLCEDGSGRPYCHPHESKERYLRLTYDYWHNGFHLQLDLPGKAVLLIALTLGDWFPLPTRRGPEWYGVSRSSLERGFRSARRAGTLEMRWGYKEAPLAAEGHTRENYYRLLPPFGPRGTLARGAHPDLKKEAAETGPSEQPKRRVRARKTKTRRKLKK